MYLLGTAPPLHLYISLCGARRTHQGPQAAPARRAQRTQRPAHVRCPGLGALKQRGLGALPHNLPIPPIASGGPHQALQAALRDERSEVGVQRLGRVQVLGPLQLPG